MQTYTAEELRELLIILSKNNGHDICPKCKDVYMYYDHRGCNCDNDE
jgi:hypothetical protein